MKLHLQRTDGWYWIPHYHPAIKATNGKVVSVFYLYSWLCIMLIIETDTRDITP